MIMIAGMAVVVVLNSLEQTNLFSLCGSGWMALKWIRCHLYNFPNFSTTSKCVETNGIWSFTSNAWPWFQCVSQSRWWICLPCEACYPVVSWLLIKGSPCLHVLKRLARNTGFGQALKSHRTLLLSAGEELTFLWSHMWVSWPQQTSRLPILPAESKGRSFFITAHSNQKLIFIATSMQSRDPEMGSMLGVTHSVLVKRMHDGVYFRIRLNWIEILAFPRGPMRPRCSRQLSSTTFLSTYVRTLSMYPYARSANVRPYIRARMGFLYNLVDCSSFIYELVRRSW